MLDLFHSVKSTLQRRAPQFCSTNGPSIPRFNESTFRVPLVSSISVFVSELASASCVLQHLEIQVDKIDLTHRIFYVK